MEESGEEGRVKNHGRASGWATGAAACRDATSGWSRCSGSEGPKCVKGETAVWAPGGASADARGVGREGRAGPPAFSRGAWGDAAGERGGPRRGDDCDRRQHEHDAPLGAVAFRVTGEKPGNGVWTYARPQAEVPLPRPATQPSLTHRRHALGAAWGDREGAGERGDGTGRAAPAQSSVSHGSRWVASQGPHDGHMPGPSLAPDPKGAREEPGPGGANAAEDARGRRAPHTSRSPPGHRVGDAGLQRGHCPRAPAPRG